VINQNDFDPKSYAARAMKAKGYDVEASDEYLDIFELQLPGWRDLLAKHRIGEDLSKAEQILTAFMQREVTGGATRILEAFAKHLDAQPKQGGSPDWIAASREMAECARCDGRGVVSNIPVNVVRRGKVVPREFSFACVCDRGRHFAGMRIAEDWMIRFAIERKKAEIAKVDANLERIGINPDADLDTQRRQFRQGIRRMRVQVASGTATAKTATPVLPLTVNKAKFLPAKHRKPEPPPQLNPERVALAVFANGDERNEWA